MKKKNKVYKLSKRSEKFYLKGIDSSEKGNYEKAIEELTKAIKIEPKSRLVFSRFEFFPASPLFFRLLRWSACFCFHRLIRFFSSSKAKSITNFHPS